MYEGRNSEALNLIVEQKSYSARKLLKVIAPCPKSQRFERLFGQSLSRATLDDVKKYDPKYQLLESEIRKEELRSEYPSRYLLTRRAGIVVWLVALVIVVILVYRACLR